MLLDLALGMTIYVVTSLFFHEPFNFLGLVVACFFASFPDIDFFLFAVLRRKYNLVSHRLIHFPLPLIFSGVIILYVFSRLLGSYLPSTIGYLVALFVSGNLSHFVHDSHGEVGIKWLWPFSDTSYKIKGFRILKANISAEEFILTLPEGKEKRSIWGEVKIRVKIEPPGIRTIIFFLIAFALCVLFWFFS